jgi:uncharacterized protein YcgL (UPF0745 family)
MLPQALSEAGPILTYLAKLSVSHRKDADRVMQQIRVMLSTPEGVMFLNLLEVSTQLTLTPILGEVRALEARNAQGFIVADLKRIASDEHEKLLQRQDDAGSARRSVARSGGTGRPGARSGA